MAGPPRSFSNICMDSHVVNSDDTVVTDGMVESE